MVRSGAVVLSLVALMRANSSTAFVPQSISSRPTAKFPAFAVVPQPLSAAVSSTALHGMSPAMVLNGVSKAGMVALRGGGGVDEFALIQSAWWWCAHLGAPAALVCGAVLTTLVGNREELAPRRSDESSTRIIKKATRFLLLSAFALEIVSIFSTTVTGTMLLALGDRTTGASFSGKGYTSPMGFLRSNLEFEYLTARISFIQGLFHWLIATGLEVAIPKENEGEAARRMNTFIWSSIVSILLFMLSFYNAHTSFYQNYFHMLSCYVSICFKRYIWRWPIRPLAVLYVPSFIYTLICGFRAIFSPPDMDKD